MSHDPNPGRKRRFLPILAVLLATTAVTACTGIIDQRGNPPDPVALESLVPGKTTRADVLQTLGSPSSSAAFGDEVWYYIATRTETFAFYKPKVLDQQVVAIAFDDKGRVRSIQRYGLDDARDVKIVDRVTPTGGRKLTVFQQLVGNLGRFAGKKSEDSAP